MEALREMIESFGYLVDDDYKLMMKNFIKRTYLDDSSSSSGDSPPTKRHFPSSSPTTKFIANFMNICSKFPLWRSLFGTSSPVTTGIISSRTDECSKLFSKLEQKVDSGVYSRRFSQDSSIGGRFYSKSGVRTQSSQQLSTSDSSSLILKADTTSRSWLGRSLIDIASSSACGNGSNVNGYGNTTIIAPDYLLTAIKVLTAKSSSSYHARVLMNLTNGNAMGCPQIAFCGGIETDPSWVHLIQFSIAEDSEIVDQPSIIGPDLFGFYKQEIFDLLTHGESYLFLNRTSVKGALNAASSSSSSKGLTLNLKRLVPDVRLFINSLANAVPVFRRDLLKASLRQSVTTLTQEVDEMVDPVICTRHVSACLKSNDEKLCTDAEKETGEVNEEDLQFLLGSETGSVEQIVTRQSNEHFEMLNHMQQQLEEILDAVVAKCRLMTHQEEQQLGKSIQLAPRNLERIVQIFNNGKSVSSDKVNIDLEPLDNNTLSRPCFYTIA